MDPYTTMSCYLHLGSLDLKSIVEPTKTTSINVIIYLSFYLCFYILLEVLLDQNGKEGTHRCITRFITLSL